MEKYGLWDFNSMQATVKRQMSQGVYLQGAYTWGRVLTTVTGGDGTNGVFAGGSGNSNDPNNRYARWGPAGYDRTNRVVIVYTWQLPGWKSGNAFERVATGGWQFSGVTTFQSGKPLTFTDARNGTAYGTASRAQFAPGRGNANIINKNGGTMLSRVKNNTYLNPSASLFVTAPAVPFSAAATTGGPQAIGYGNSSIGSALGPCNDNEDMTVST